jgi:hypothetical protein
MRLILPILLLALYSCIRKNSDPEVMTSCKSGRQEAIEDFRAGKILFIRNGFVPRYDSVLEVVLESSGIEYSFDMFGHLYSDCYPNTMDSLLKAKFGNGFMDKLELVSDRLFFEKRKNTTFDNYEVDTWAMRTGNDKHLGGDFIINYLNEKRTPKSAFKFGSNIAGRPHYLIEFTVDKKGETKNVEIRERNNTEKFKETEEIVVKEISKIKDWIPATIRRQPVTAKFQMGVAIEIGD